MGPLGDPVLGQRDGKGAEGVGLDDIAPHLEVLGVQLAQDVGAGDGEQLVAALEVGSAEVVGREIAVLDAGAHGAVEDDDSLTGGVRKELLIVRVLLACRRRISIIAGAGAITPFPSGQLGQLRRPSARASSGAGGIGTLGPVKIYTRTGDDGTTGLLYGGRVPKDSALPTAYGSVDEAQASIGVARTEATDPVLAELVLGIERDLWVLMAELATDPDNRHKLVDGKSLVTDDMVERLEHLIDDFGESFEPPTEFVVPGETRGAALLDVARTVVRRAERDALSAAAQGSAVVTYLNRLSDLLWTLARWQEGVSRPTRSVASS